MKIYSRKLNLTIESTNLNISVSKVGKNEDIGINDINIFGFCETIVGDKTIPQNSDVKLIAKHILKARK